MFQMGDEIDLEAWYQNFMIFPQIFWNILKLRIDNGDI